jgi:photosystem II stability/assembly factor-like uncharacterized protein
MKEHEPGSTGRDDDLLRRWHAVTARSAPAPAEQLLASREHRPRRRPALGSLMVAAATVAAVITGMVGGAALLSFRHDLAATDAPATGASLSPTASRQGSPGPTIGNASGPELAAHEHVVQMERTAKGGWLLTASLETPSRLRMLDGSGWRDCWSDPDGVTSAPRAVVAGSSIRISSGMTLWTSTDGCASWTRTVSPGAATGLAFPTESTGYLAFTEYGDTPRGRAFKTVDGGRQWSPIAGKIKLGGDLGLALADAQHGWLTDTRTLWTTSDGGSTWVATALPVPATVKGRLDAVGTPVVGADGSATVVVKYDATPGMDGAAGQQVFYRTQDLGAHWVALSVVTDPGTLGISIVDPTTWVVFDPSTAAFRNTADGGVTWQTVAVRKSWPYNRGPLTFADSQHGWMLVREPNPPCAAGVQCDYVFGPSEHLAATEDGGMTWVELEP